MKYKHTNHPAENQRIIKYTGVQFPRRKNFMEEVFSVLTQENTKNDSAATTLPGEKTGSSAHGFNRF
jgi:hypothetical protein